MWIALGTFTISEKMELLESFVGGRLYDRVRVKYRRKWKGEWCGVEWMRKAREGEKKGVHS